MRNGAVQIPKRKVYEWYLSYTTRARFEELANDILQLQSLPDEDSELQQAALEAEVRELPGFPREAKSWDIIRFVPLAKPISTASAKSLAN